MADSLFSPSWYRVAGLRPALRKHAQIHRHEYRGQVWYILQDLLTGRYHRFSPAAYQVLGMMNGEHSLQQIWDAALDKLGDDAPGQEELIVLLARLHGSDVLQCDVPPDSLELFRRYQQQRRAKLLQKIRSPLALRFPLFDPERLLTQLLPLVKPLYSWFGAALWAGTVALAAVLAGLHWPELTEDIVDRILVPQNLLILWLTYPVVKALHEFGHGFTTKVWGGEVHEMGVMLLVFMPVPYVDASSASAFADKRKRMLVGAAGILVEIFLASLALLVWLSTEPGIVRTVAYNVMLIGGVSTLFFNGNPLLRFDGYYVLSDAIEIPNLGKRSNDYVAYLIQRYLFKIDEAESPATKNSERKWFLWYGLASFIYRMFVMFAIVLFIAGKFFFIGVALAIWALFTTLVLPVGKILGFLLKNNRLLGKRKRAISISAGLLASVAGVLLFLPAPLLTRAEGVVWFPQQSLVRAGTECFVQGFLARPDEQVKEHEPLLSCSDPFLDAQAKILSARLRELEALYDAQWREDRVAARLTSEEIKVVKGDLATTQQRIGELVIRSPAAGRFLAPQARDLPGRFLSKGETVAYILSASTMKVRVGVLQDYVGLIRRGIEKVEVRTADRIARVIPAVIERQIPGGSNRLPSAVLGAAGGGEIPIDTRDPSGTRTFQPVFEYELALAAEHVPEHVGIRVFVRFDHGYEPLALQWYRALRQLFLGSFGV
jgi:putative peptide zinc metalloprotease protein